MILRRISVSGLSFLVVGLVATTLQAQNTTTTTTTSNVAGGGSRCGRRASNAHVRGSKRRTNSRPHCRIEALTRRGYRGDERTTESLVEPARGRCGETRGRRRETHGCNAVPRRIATDSICLRLSRNGRHRHRGTGRGLGVGLVGPRSRHFERGTCHRVARLDCRVACISAQRQRKRPVIRCSIDPTKEGLANLQQFLTRVGGGATPDQTGFIVDGLRKSLGLQNVTIGGVPADTHFAKVLVEADYRMKLIGIGLERTSVKMKSYVDFASPTSVARNAMQRWYFVPDYECVRVSEDELAMELVGNSVKLIGPTKWWPRMAHGRTPAS